MRLSSSIGTLCKQFTCEESIEMMYRAGFDALDFSFFDERFYGEDTENESCQDYFRKLRTIAEEKGMRFNQAHAPFASSFADEAQTKKRFDEIVRSMRLASLLGIETTVVHPVQHLRYLDEGVPEKLFEMNMEFYKRLIPYCEEYNIKVALENMWQAPYNGKINHSTCSKPEEFIRYLDELNSEWFVACLDIGHASLVCEDPANFIRKLGCKRLKALHVHDVDGFKDSHTLPYYGIVDWDSVAGALKDIGYTGDFTLEAGNFLNAIPKEVWGSGLDHMAKVSRHIMGKIV